MTIEYQLRLTPWSPTGSLPDNGEASRIKIGNASPLLGQGANNANAPFLWEGMGWV